MALPSPGVEYVVDQGQCVLLFQAVRVAYDFCVWKFLVHLIADGGVVVVGSVRAGINARCAMCCRTRSANGPEITTS